MALHWDFNNKIGKVHGNKYGRDYTFYLYNGNAMLIAVNEFEDNGKEMYNVAWWLDDENHARLMLGLKKPRFGGEQYNRLEDDGIKRIELAKNCRDLRKIRKLFAEAMPNVELVTVEEV